MPIITTYLEDEIKQKLREQGIVIWLDKDAHYMWVVLLVRYGLPSSTHPTKT